MKPLLIFYILLLSFVGAAFTASNSATEDERFIDHRVDLKKQTIQFYWKDEKGQLYRSLGALKQSLHAKGKKLVFATNGGMYQTDNSPLGLYIENGKVLNRLNTKDATGNFYLKPNGVFYITNDNKAGICTTQTFENNSKIKYATQSGPMLVIDGKLHSAFQKNSTNLNIRNGVGVLPDGKIMFVISRKEINFYEFATYFQNAGCKYALYLDGFVSRTYLPEKNWTQTDGDFGVIIGETSK